MDRIVTFPRVSVIIPTYNRAVYIGETIESIRSQTYTNWEMIIIDDGSDDNTEEIIERINDNRIQFHKAGRIAVRSKIKNIGLEKATGELIAFNDSDDLWEQTKLEKQVIALQQYPNAGFCLTGGYNFKNINDPSEYFYKQREGIKYGNIFISFFKSEVAATTSTLIVRKECVLAIGGFKVEPLSEVNFILRLAKKFNAIILYEPLFFRRLHDSNLSSLKWEKRQRQGPEMIRSYKGSLPPKVVANSLFNSYVNFGEQYLQRKKTRAATFQFFKAWKYKPFSIVPFKKMIKAILLTFKK